LNDINRLPTLPEGIFYANQQKGSNVITLFSKKYFLKHIKSIDFMGIFRNVNFRRAY
jgi:hypothetical protein